MSSTTKRVRKGTRTTVPGAVQVVRAPHVVPARDAVRVQRDASREPRLPHERDESADSQQKGPPDTQAIGRKAYDDIQAGRVDTDRGPVLEQLGRRLPSNEAPAPAKPRRSR